MKIAVIGYAGSGKSTLAAALGRFYQLPVLFLDRVQFTPGWVERDRAEALRLVEAFMGQAGWVIDGNYTDFLQARRLAEADEILFFNFNRFACLFRVLRRYQAFHNRVRASAADGCIERLNWAFIRWILFEGRTRSRRAHYRNILQAYGKKTIVIKNQRALSAFYQARGLPDPAPISGE